jgi:uncharacterized membrane-anchored protein YitT (DUF2179 family)
MRDIVYIIVGSFLIAFATVGFLTPNSMITGGGVGIAQLFYVVSGLFTLGSWVAIVSIPLLMLGTKYFGKAYLLKSILAIILISLSTDILREVIRLEPITLEHTLGAIFGGLIIGVGVGLIIISNSSTGGTTILAQVITKKTHIKTSVLLLIMDTIIMTTAMIVYDDIQKGLYSILGIYVTSKVMELIISGKPSQKAVSIVTNEIEKVSANLLLEFGQHGTILKGVALNGKDDRNIILIIVDLTNLQRLKEMVKECDEDAFLVIQEASELYGRD